MTQKLKLVLTTLPIFLFAVSIQAQESAQEIIDKTIEISGGQGYENYTMEFDFRDNHYVSKRYNGVFVYSRIGNKEGDEVKITYGNMEPFSLTVNGEQKDIPQNRAFIIQNSINSVNYFALLPYGLNDKAVFKTYKGSKTIKGLDYHVIEVKFSEDGGGKDFEDVYVYWINKNTNKVDYLAYSYVVNGGGLRFREAYNERYVEGIRFVDYNNYKPNDAVVGLTELPNLFETGQLKLLSKIELEHITVN